MRFAQVVSLREVVCRWQVMSALPRLPHEVPLLLAMRAITSPLASLLHLVLDLIPNVLVEGLVLALLEESSLILWQLGRIYHAVTSSGTNLCESFVPSLLCNSEFDFLVWVTVGGVARVSDHVGVASLRTADVKDSRV